MKRQHIRVRLLSDFMDFGEFEFYRIFILWFSRSPLFNALKDLFHGETDFLIFKAFINTRDIIAKPTIVQVN